MSVPADRGPRRRLLAEPRRGVFGECQLRRSDVRENVDAWTGRLRSRRSETQHCDAAHRGGDRHSAECGQSGRVKRLPTAETTVAEPVDCRPAGRRGRVVRGCGMRRAVVSSGRDSGEGRPVAKLNHDILRTVHERQSHKR